MIRKAAFLAAVLSTHALLAGWGSPCETTITVLPDLAQINSLARCSYATFGTQDNSVEIQIQHTIEPGSLVDVCVDAGYCGTTITVKSYAASTLYTSTAEVKARQMIIIDQQTLTAAAKTPDPVKKTCADSNYNGTCDVDEPLDPSDTEACSPTCPNSPLLINLSSGAWHLSGSEDPVLFDIDADGSRNRITWTARGSALAFLAADRNGNGIVDDGAELFGNWTILTSGLRANNGFEALKEFDSNGDGVVSAADARWGALLMWIDANHDAVSQPAELRHVRGSEVERLNTDYHWTGRRDQNGNYFGYVSLAQLGGAARAYYDVYLRTVP